MTQQDDRSRLIDAARARIAGGDSKFSIGMVCRDAGVDRDAFRACFKGKAELLAAASEAAPASAPEPVRTVAAEPAASAAVGDAWLERRLRVFERALTALEARADANVRNFNLEIARLEEKVNLAAGGAVVNHAMAAGAENQVVTTRFKPSRADLEAAIAAAAPEAPEIPAPTETSSGIANAETPDDARARQDALVLPLDQPSQESAPSKEEMAELLESARRAARAALAQAEEKKDEKKPTGRLRWFALGGLSLVAMFVCVGVTFSNAARATRDAMDEGAGVTRRHVAADAFARIQARADYGDAAAQAQLALGYLRGDHGAADSRAAAHWAGQAAGTGQAIAQYVLGTLYHNGDGVAADPKLAFAYFTQSAEQGNVKAMHNLAIAYAEGLGTEKDPAKAADWFARAAARGYVDSAFDLAVLYERGTGVKQDLGAALKWYKVAALEGDQPSQARIEVLSQQLPARDATLAVSAAQAFMPQKVDLAANLLPKF